MTTPTFTPKYNLEKPHEDDFYNVDVPNANMDKIDAALKALSDALGGIDLTTLSQAITAVDDKVTEHSEDIMPHKYMDGPKTYRWGFRTVGGEPEFIYEEVL
ncbi:hypothetical protein [Lysinibacillus sp. FSL W8-0992]|uniref:hypothetical protein n=1 Tax=Lysinibacillus sp. FSL W8-0992 TaxID=2954643 RepID=UPI0030F6CF56